MQLYQQSLTILEALGDVRGKAATLHQMAGVLVTRGDLDAAMQLYQQSLTILEALGDVQGKAATLINMAQLLFARSERVAALQLAQESLQLFERLGATREVAQVKTILAQLSAASTAAPVPDNLSAAQLAGALVAATTRALRGEIPPEALRAELAGLTMDDPLAAYVAALLRSLDREPAAPEYLLSAAEPILAAASPAESTDLLSGIANIAALLEDAEVEQVARRRAINVQRQAGDDRETLVQLSVMLYNLAMDHQKRRDFGAAVSLLEEVVALDQRTGHPDLESDRAALEAARRRAAGIPEPTLRDAISAWRAGNPDQESLAELLNLIFTVVVATMQNGDAATRDTLAQELAHLRAARPLPIAGTNDLLHVLQLWLRDEPGMAEQAARIRTTLPSSLADVLQAMEYDIAGLPADDPAPSQAAPEPAAALAATLLADLPPLPSVEQPVLQQVLPVFLAAAQALHDPRATTADQARLAPAIMEMADQAAAGESAGSPWLDAAAALRALAQLLRGLDPDLTPVTPLYRILLERTRSGQAPTSQEDHNDGK
jgi:tetratricopeptide (TPR) repeat protein